MNLSLQERRDRFATAFDKVPGADTGERLTWLEQNMGCSRQTAITWKMRDTMRPIPTAKLLLLERLVVTRTRKK